MTQNKNPGENLTGNDSDVFEICLDESEQYEYTIALPLSHNFKIAPMEGKGRSVPVFSITNSGIKTIIETPTAATKWKVVVMKPAQDNESSEDPTGKPKEDGGDENGDGFVDWLRQTAGENDKMIKEKLKDVKRRIIFRRVTV